MKKMKGVNKGFPRRGKQGRKERQETLDEALRELIDGKLLGDRIIWRNMGLILFFTFLIILYIYNRNQIEARYRARTSLIQEVEKARYESLSATLELMKISSQAEIVRRIEREGLGLEISKEPPVIIEK